MFSAHMEAVSSSKKKKHSKNTANQDNSFPWIYIARKKLAPEEPDNLGQHQINIQTPGWLSSSKPNSGALALDNKE